jgi:hypothetical protein
MFQMTIRMTDQQAARVNAALERNFTDDEEHPDETARQRARRWVKMVFVDLVFGDERRQAQSDVAADLELDVEDVP